MNHDDSSGPNGSLSSMPDHSRMPGDFHSYSVEKSSAIQSPSASIEYNKANRPTAFSRPNGVRPAVPQSHGASIYSDVYQTSNYNAGSGGGGGDNTWMRDPYEEAVRERRSNNQSLREPERNGSRNLGMQSNINGSSAPFSNEEPSELEIDQSYKTFLRLKKIYIFYIFPVISIIIMGLNIYFAYSTDRTHFPSLEEVNAQFESHPIIDMNLMERTSECSGLYIDTKMGFWPGYESLCHCATSVSQGTCSIRQLNEGCSTVGPLHQIKLSFWGGKRICTRKAEGSIKQYYQKLSTNSNGDTVCEDDLKKCVISSNGNAICMGRFEFCPITKIIVDEGKMDDAALRKWKGQLHFKNKTLLFENEENKGTALLDINVRFDECIQVQDNSKRIDCELEKVLLDRAAEFNVLKDNTLKADRYEIVKGLNQSIALFGQPAQYLEMCKFNKTFNPTILGNELGNWDRVKTLRFVNPFFLCSLLILNFVRTSVLDYLNTKTAARTLLRRKKELYNVFGFFTGSSVMITCEVLIILYYIFWGYLLLNQSRMIGQRWLDMSCITGELRNDVQHMMDEISRVEAYNMVTIGPMIICCILEALFAQYKLINLEVMDHLRD